MTNPSTKIKVSCALLSLLTAGFLSLGGGSPIASASTHPNGMRVNGMRVNGTSVDGAEGRPEFDGIILPAK